MHIFYLYNLNPYFLLWNSQGEKKIHQILQCFLVQCYTFNMLSSYKTFFKADTFKLSSFQHTNCPCLPWWRPPACFSNHRICYYVRCKTVLEWQLSLRRGHSYSRFLWCLLMCCDSTEKATWPFQTIYPGQDRKWHFFKSQLVLLLSKT